jgi:copper chaperone
MSCGGVSSIIQAVQTIDTHAIVSGDPYIKMVSVETKASETAIKDAILLQRRFANAKVAYPAN